MNPLANTIELSRETTARNADTRDGSLGFRQILRWLAGWIRIQKLQFQLWDNRRFQRRCEKIGCFTLAELEHSEICRIEQEILQLKEERRSQRRHSELFSSKTPQPP